MSIHSPFSASNGTFYKMDLATACVSCQVSWKLWSGFSQFRAFCGIGHSQTPTPYSSKWHLIKLYQPWILLCCQQPCSAASSWFTQDPWSHSSECSKCQKHGYLCMQRQLQFQKTPENRWGKALFHQIDTSPIFLALKNYSKMHTT